MEDGMKKKEVGNASDKEAQEEEITTQKAERIRLKREAAFGAELKKMNDELQKKAQNKSRKMPKLSNEY